MTTTAVRRPERTTDDAARDDLTRLVFDDTFGRVHADIRATVLDPIFDTRPGLSLPEAGRLAYQRSRYVHASLERPREILRDPLRLFALAEWPPLLDVSTFSLLMVHYNLTLGTVVDHSRGRTDLDDYLEELDSLTSFGVYMATELGFGNNVAALRTEATYDPSTETFVLRTPEPIAHKYMSYSGFTDIPKLAVVMARVKVDGRDQGVFPFVVRITDRTGLRPGVGAAPCPEKPVQGLDNGVTWFDDVRVPRRNLLSGDMGGFLPDGSFHTTGGNARRRFLRAMSRIVPGRLCVSGAALSMGRASVYIALRYARQRLTSAPARNDLPVIEYRAHQLALYGSLAKVYALTFLLNHAKRGYVEGTCGEAELNSLVAITKALCTWEATDIVTVCRERCGAQGIFSANRIVDYASLLQGLVTAEGDNQVLLATTAAQLLTRPLDASVPRPVDPAGRDVTDPDFQATVLHHREHDLRDAARAVMADSSGSYLDTWNQVMNTALAMARCRGARIALQRILAAVDDARTDDSREALRLLASMYGLLELRADTGWYLARGLLTADQALAVPGELDALCPRLTRYVDMLIGAFQLSPELLRAPIAADDYVSSFQRLIGVETDSR